MEGQFAPQNLQICALLNCMSNNNKQYVCIREPETVAQVSRLAVLAEKNCSSNGSVQNESLHAKFDEMSKQLQQLTLSSVNVIQVERAWGQNQRNFSQSRVGPLILISPGQIFCVTDVQLSLGIGGFVQL